MESVDEWNDVEFVLRGSDEEVVGEDEDDDGELSYCRLITGFVPQGDVGDGDDEGFETGD